MRGIYYEERGPRNGAPLIFSSGLGGSGNYWRPNIEQSAQYVDFQEEHRVILYDHRGTGRSDRILPPVVSVEEMADDMLAVMDATGVQKANLVGHAAGAAAALSIAIHRPERVQTLTLVNGWSFADPHFLRCFDARLALLRDSGPRAYVRAQPLFLYPPDWISDNAARLASEDDDHLAHFAGVEAYEKRIAALAAFDVDARLSDVSVPTLVLAAADDMLVPPKCSRHLATHIRGAQHRVMPWGGHACNVTDPATFNRLVLDFLRS
ncbi:pyrimidine utilization protein D [Sphingobium sp. KCTC 72723]|uniref:pyrimidine utilization protein D n=1 Tax=Sphingobium sp. KCTC 72723 TaxID=2733867 RepID=UPI00292D557B|nr:pyrimidine utilization protein D [Sphingobium sp. KCTC 72723]